MYYCAGGNGRNKGSRFQGREAVFKMKKLLATLVNQKYKERKNMFLMQKFYWRILSFLGVSHPSDFDETLVFLDGGNIVSTCQTLRVCVWFQ